jgi:hypothetical protein
MPPPPPPPSSPPNTEQRQQQLAVVPPSRSLPSPEATTSFARDLFSSDLAFLEPMEYTSKRLPTILRDLFLADENGRDDTVKRLLSLMKNNNNDQQVYADACRVASEVCAIALTSGHWARSWRAVMTNPANSLVPKRMKERGLIACLFDAGLEYYLSEWIGHVSPKDANRAVRKWNDVLRQWVVNPLDTVLRGDIKISTPVPFHK